MRRVITYGTFDLLHYGHINILRRAKELGDYLIVGVTNDSFDRERGKLNVRNNVLERVEAVKETGYADQIIIEDYVGQKIDDIQKQMEKLYKQQKQGKTIRLNNKIWEYTLGAIEAVNEGIENNARFATYRASRHYAGRTKARSAYDAKEITVNFNRKGNAADRRKVVY